MKNIFMHGYIKYSKKKKRATAIQLHKIEVDKWIAWGENIFLKFSFSMILFKEGKLKSARNTLSNKPLRSQETILKWLNKKCLSNDD